MWYILFFIIFIIIIYMITLLNFDLVVKRKVCDQKEIYENQIQRGLFDRDKYEKLKKENVEIISKDGLKLRGVYIEGDKGIGRTMIFVHGITVGIPFSIKYIDMFISRGWSVLMYDQRRHGMSEGKYSTYGFYEKDDLDLWVNWVAARNGKNTIIGLHGESMGAATVLQYLPINKHASFAIADCAYSDLDELLAYHMKHDYHLPSFPFVNLSSLMARKRAKFSFKDVSPIKAVENVEIPVLFVHGSIDTFVPCYMSEEMYNAKKGKKAIYIADGAKHACSIEVNKEKYEDEVMKFIDEVLESRS